MLGAVGLIAGAAGLPTGVLAQATSPTKVGYVIGGGGGEYAVSRALSFKIEYLYFCLGTVNYAAGPDTLTTADQPGVSQGISYRYGGQIVRASVNFRCR